MVALAVVGALFGALAAATAFVIVWSEYARHRMGRRRVWKEAFAAAALAFVVFFAGAMLVGAMIGRG
jgi:hypothetical protein